MDNGHGINTLGKCSPDQRLREYAWAREIAKRLDESLRSHGYDSTRIVTEDTDVPLTQRVQRVNRVCKSAGAQNVLLVSLHNNAAGSGGWNTARGFSAFVSKNASSNSKRLASLLTDEAMARNLLGNRSIPKEKYWTWSWTSSDIYILKNTNCPAVLTENLFMDNRDDCAFLLSEAGKTQIVDLHLAAIQKYIHSL